MPAAPPADYHTHTSLCKHAVGRPLDYARQALALGLSEFGASDHSPMPHEFDDWRMLWEEFPTYLAWVDEARQALPDFPIRLGLEVDFFPHAGDWLDELANAAPWDYWIGSVHYLGDWAMDNPALAHRFTEGDLDEIWTQYWKLFNQCARSKRFDILAHADLVKKFGHRPGGDLRRFYVPAVQAVVDAGAAIEINTAGLFKEAAEMYPAPAFLALAAEAGVPLVISSDAHRPEDVGRAFPEALNAAKAAGFKELAQFAQRQRRMVPLA